MTRIEYDKQLNSLREKHQIEIRDLAYQFAVKNNPYNIGDVIKDHIGFGRIQKIKVRAWPQDPSCIYECENLTQKMTINKREPKRDIYQENVIL